MIILDGGVESTYRITFGRSAASWYKAVDQTEDNGTSAEEANVYAGDPADSTAVCYHTLNVSLYLYSGNSQVAGESGGNRLFSLHRNPDLQIGL